MFRQRAGVCTHMRPFAKEHALFSFIDFKGNLSLLEIFCSGGLSTWKDGELTLGVTPETVLNLSVGWESHKVQRNDFEGTHGHVRFILA